MQYQPWKTGPMAGLQLAVRQRPGGRPSAVRRRQLRQRPGGRRNTVVDASGLSPDQQFEAGLFCGSVHATPPSAPIRSALRSAPTGLCPLLNTDRTLLQIPAPGTENDDNNPPRIAPRNLFDLAVGHDNLFHGDRYKVESPAHRHQPHQQVRALQLSLHLQRDALRDAALADG